MRYQSCKRWRTTDCWISDITPRNQQSWTNLCMQTKKKRLSINACILRPWVYRRIFYVVNKALLCWKADWAKKWRRVFCDDMAHDECHCSAVPADNWNVGHLTAAIDWPHCGASKQQTSWIGRDNKLYNPAGVYPLVPAGEPTLFIIISMTADLLAPCSE